MIAIKILKIGIFFFFWTLLVMLNSCNNVEFDEILINKSDITNKLFLTKDQVNLLNNVYPFINYKQGIDMRNDINFINSVKKDFLESNYSKLIDNFDCSKVTVIEWDDYFSYTLASESIDGEYYTIVLSKDVNNESKIKHFEKESFLLNIDATEDGTGTLKETYKYGVNIAVFDKGRLCKVNFEDNTHTLRSGGIASDNKGEIIEDPLQGGRFRACFDEAYNTICDGFIGCLAWYSNPNVPAVAAIWCAAKKTDESTITYDNHLNLIENL